MKSCSSNALIFGITFLCMLFVSTAQAVIQTSGDVDPADPTNWDSSAELCVGSSGSGTVTINNGDSATVRNGCLGKLSDSTGLITVNGGEFSTQDIEVSRYGNGTLIIKNGGTVNGFGVAIAAYSDSTSLVTVNGDGSTWDFGQGLLGCYGDSVLKITNGGTVQSFSAIVARHSGSTSSVLVDGIGSTWESGFELFIGDAGSGILEITGGGLVVNDMSFEIDSDNDGDSFVNMATGGMLALAGQAESLDAFFGLIDGTDAIRYWDESIGPEGDWAPLAPSTSAEVYSLEYVTEGELSGYTVLTVGVVPEPSTLVLFVLGGLSGLGCWLLRRKR